MQNKEPLLSIKNLNFTYEREPVLVDINLEVYEKDFLVLIGPNGGGKSTLMKLILGLLPLQSGKITIFNQKVKKVLSHIGYVPQNTNINLNFPIKAIDVVMMGAKEDKTLALEVLKEVSMQEYAQSKIGLLSGGQRQRIMIARALYNRPKILLLDEPTSSIDVDGQKKIYELLKELNKEITIIVISHDLSVIMKYATKVAHIQKRLTYHSLESLKKRFNTGDEHMCEVELLQMLGKVK